MQTNTSAAQKRRNLSNNDTVESLKNTPPPSMAKATAKAFGDIGAGIGKGMMDTFFGTDYNKTEQGEKPRTAEHKTGTFQRTGEFKRLYDSKEIAEKHEIEKILVKIHQEVKGLSKASSVLAEQVKDIEKLTLSSAEIEPGIYHVTFLELVLSFLKTLRAKIDNSNVWLEAMQTKKKKRGSLFTSLSKKHGTSFSESNEHKVVRSTQ